MVSGLKLMVYDSWFLVFSVWGAGVCNALGEHK